MSPTSYLRYPHVSADLVTFVAENDIWLAPLEGGRAWRISGMGLPARGPRFTPDGSALVWSVVQGSAPEVVTAGTDGGGYRQLTYWDSRPPGCGASLPGATSWWPAPTGRRTSATAGRGPSRSTAAPPGCCPTVRWTRCPGARPSATSTRWSSAAPSAASRPTGSGTAAAPPASCGSTATAAANSAGWFRSWTATSAIRCGSADASRSSPTTRATATSTRSPRTARTCAATRTTPSSLPATSPPTGNGWSTSTVAGSLSWTRSRPNPAGWRFSSARPATDAAAARWPPPGT